MKRAGSRSHSHSMKIFLDVRMDTYAFMASVFSQPPSDALLQQIQGARWEPGVPGELLTAWKNVCQAAHDQSQKSIESEFLSLFVGLGRGKVVPYASWYLEGLLMAMPLASIRNELKRFGICRNEKINEPEDHAGLLCEIIALLGLQPHVDKATYARFFYQYVSSWLPVFFQDVKDASSAGFYWHVSNLGGRLLDMENAYLEKVA